MFENQHLFAFFHPNKDYILLAYPGWAFFDTKYTINGVRKKKLKHICIALYLVTKLFIFLSRESDQSAVTSSLRICQPFVYHSKMGNTLKYLTQRHKKSKHAGLFSTLPLHCWASSRKACEYLLLSHCFNRTQNQTIVNSFRGRRFIHSAIWAV